MTLRNSVIVDIWVFELCNQPEGMWACGHVRLGLFKGPSRVGVSCLTDPVSKMLCFLVFRIPDDG
jgi:hypothetical protein